eukprot:TRINITY_DN13834_c0_g1_i3.p1 TRINITY_DN13834_c0_g1~~TRINITY_DN13834_c0_g1_i3.p1  ORF type:complete len:252 (+),score=8.63 TRINITY_DN13834_c0_g1_i3:217-972(+)
MELDPSRVVSATAGISFSDSLKCAICHNVASAPVECAHCQSLFCGPCIQKWIQTSDSCPFRCAATATFQANQPHRVIRAALASLRFTCSHIAQGCQEQIPYEKVDQHEALCAFAPVQCPNDGCQTLVLRKDIQSHALETCEARMLTCCICTLTYPANSRGNHDCIKSLLNDRGILLHTIEELSLRLRESELIIQDLQGKKDAKVMETESTWNCCPKNHQLVFYHDETVMSRADSDAMYARKHIVSLANQHS